MLGDELKYWLVNTQPFFFWLFVWGFLFIFLKHPAEKAVTQTRPKSESSEEEEVAEDYDAIFAAAKAEKNQTPAESQLVPQSSVGRKSSLSRQVGVVTHETYVATAEPMDVE